MAGAGLHKRFVVRAASAGALAVLLSAGVLPPAAAAPDGASAPTPRGPAVAPGTTQLLSVAVDGGPADGHSDRPVISANGRVAAFTSRATNLVADDTNDRSDLFVRDLRGGEIRRVLDPYGEITSPTLNANGRYLAYTATSAEGSAVMVRDLWKGTTERADVDLSMEHSDGHAPAISADGRTVAFAVHGDPAFPGALAVYLRDLSAGRTERVTLPAGSDDAFRGFRAPALSADGRRVAYQYVHGTPPRGDWSDLYVYDRDTGGETQVDTAHDGSPADGAATNPLFSADGDTLAFDSSASNLVPGRDPNNSHNPFVCDLRTGTLERIDAVLPGPEGVLSVDGVSADGSKLLLDTWPILTVDDAEYVRDLRTGSNVLVSPDKDGRPGNAIDARTDGAARTVVFSGFDSANFVAGDTNGFEDVFVFVRKKR